MHWIFFLNNGFLILSDIWILFVVQKLWNSLRQTDGNFSKIPCTGQIQNQSKCYFGFEVIVILGHIQPRNKHDPKKVEAILQALIAEKLDLSFSLLAPDCTS